METNPYEYDRTVSWRPQQNQIYEGSYVTAHRSQQRPAVLQNQGPQARGVDQKPKPPKAMPKARALALANTFKKWLVVASIIGFGTFSGLTAYHQVGTTATTTSSTSSQTSTTTSSSQNSNGFFKQQGGNNLGSSNSSNGTSTSSNGSSSGSNNTSQPAVSGSSVS